MIARAFATEQTTGTWFRTPAVTPDMRNRLGEKVLGIYEFPDYETGTPKEALRRPPILIAFPWVNFENDLSTMFSAIIGSVMAYGRVKFVGMWMPPPYFKLFKD